MKSKSPLYVKWEEQVTAHIAAILDIPTGDAQAILEATHYDLNSLYVAHFGSATEDIAKMIVAQ